MPFHLLEKVVCHLKMSFHLMQKVFCHLKMPFHLMQKAFCHLKMPFYLLQKVFCHLKMPFSLPQNGTALWEKALRLVKGRFGPAQNAFCRFRKGVSLFEEIERLFGRPIKPPFLPNDTRLRYTRST